jgi:hypothetical protein
MCTSFSRSPASRREIHVELAADLAGVETELLRCVGRQVQFELGVRRRGEELLVFLAAIRYGAELLLSSLLVIPDESAGFTPSAGGRSRA